MNESVTSTEQHRPMTVLLFNMGAHTVVDFRETTVNILQGRRHSWFKKTLNVTKCQLHEDK